MQYPAPRDASGVPHTLDTGRNFVSNAVEADTNRGNNLDHDALW